MTEFSGDGAGEDIGRIRSQPSGMRARRRLKDVPEVKRHELVERGIDLGLEAARSINDRNISLFSRVSEPYCCFAPWKSAVWLRSARGVGAALAAAAPE